MAPPAPRVPLVDPETRDPGVADLFDAIRAHGGGPLNLHRALANAPALLGPYLDLAFALRTKTTTPRKDRELIILRTLQLVGGEYGFAHHRRMGRAFGLTDDQIEHLAAWHGSEHFTDRERALLQFTDETCAMRGVERATVEAVARFLPPSELVEVTLTAGFYTAVAQLTTALQVPLDENAEQSTYGLK